MARTRARERVNGKRAAIYARVSDKSQDEDDKTSISEQTGEMEAYCEQEGHDHNRPIPGGGQGLVQEAPRVPEDAGRRQAGTLRHHRLLEVRPPQQGHVPRRRLMEVVEAYQIQLEAVMDAIDMKTFGLMAAIGRSSLTTSESAPPWASVGRLNGVEYQPVRCLMAI